ncbi:MAG: hypothetical protein ACRYFX_13515 [Janthinobacterium lividum]
MPFPGSPRGPRGRFAFFALAAAGLALLLGGVVMLLWNAVLPAATHAGPLTYWQGVALLVLCRLLFGSFGGGRRGGGLGGPAAWAAQREKWQQMTPEERQQFRQRWQARRGRWGGPPAPDEAR